jgi:hypothetical protein
MATELPAGNDLLHQLPGLPVREHFREQNPESSPPTTPSPEVHPGASPEAGAKGAVG